MTRPIALCLLLVACTRYPRDYDGDGFFSHQDCNDRDPNINILAPEIPFDGVDNDCNPLTLDADSDQDGVAAIDDCNDADPSVPGPEEYYDGVDNDCDPATADDDQDGDGSVVGDDCDDTDASAVPGGEEVFGDGVDNDCDPSTLDGDADGDGVDGSADCDDADPLVLGPRSWFVDCDGDGFAAADAAVTEGCEVPAPSGTCGDLADGWTEVEPVDIPHTLDNLSTDCGDLDPNAFPGQLEYFTEASATLLPFYRYDFNCNGQDDPETLTFACYAAPTSGCVAEEGFIEVTYCGGSGDATDQCEGDVVCTPGEVYTLTQGCR